MKKDTRMNISEIQDAKSLSKIRNEKKEKENLNICSKREETPEASEILKLINRNEPYKMIK